MSGRPWSADEHEFVRRHYADNPTNKLALSLRRPRGSVYQHAAKMGLRKSAAYLASPDAHRITGTHPNSVAHRFQPGIIPFNKGLRRPGWSPGRMAETQFKKGNRPHTWRPVGYITTDADGYLRVKIAEGSGGHGNPNVWAPVHKRAWEKVHGPVPSGMHLCFKVGDRLNCSIDNLELRSCAEMMRRNSVHRLPKELADVIMLKGALNRKIHSMQREANA